MPRCLRVIPPTRYGAGYDPQQKCCGGAVGQCRAQPGPAILRQICMVRRYRPREESVGLSLGKRLIYSSTCTYRTEQNGVFLLDLKAPNPANKHRQRSVVGKVVPTPRRPETGGQVGRSFSLPDLKFRGYLK